MKKAFFLLIVLIITGAAITLRVYQIKGEALIEHDGIATINSEKGYPVEVVPVLSGKFEVWRSIQGQVMGSREESIKTPDAARIASINYQVGDIVPADTPIILLDENDPKNMTRVKLLKRVYGEALSDYNKYKRLAQKGHVPQDAVNKLRLKLNAAKSDLDSAKTTVELVSPVSGVLITLNARVGERANPKKSLAVISEIDEVRIIATISDRDSAEIKLGQAVRITASDGSTVGGLVDRISLGADAQTGLVKMEMMVDNQDHKLMTGTYVTAHVRIFFEEQAQYVDSRCVFADVGGHEFIYQVENGAAKKIPVTVLVANEEYSILEGINPDLPVVLSGISQISDGAKVRIVGQESEK